MRTIFACLLALVCVAEAPAQFRSRGFNLQFNSFNGGFARQRAFGVGFGLQRGFGVGYGLPIQQQLFAAPVYAAPVMQQQFAAPCVQQQQFMSPVYAAPAVQQFAAPVCNTGGCNGGGAGVTFGLRSRGY